jgi:predicted transcriptional regulator
MTLEDVHNLLLCDVFSGYELLGRSVSYGCASDLMSDVLAFSQSGALLLTGLVNVQTIQTAHIAEINAIVLVRGKKPDSVVLAAALDKAIPLLGTPYSMYEACGILYKAGIPSTMKCAHPLAPSTSG